VFALVGLLTIKLLMLVVVWLLYLRYNSKLNNKAKADEVMFVMFWHNLHVAQKSFVEFTLLIAQYNIFSYLIIQKFS